MKEIVAESKTLKDALETEHKPEIIKICLELGNRLRYRREDLRRFFRTHGLNVSFSTCDLKEVIKELNP